MAASSSFSRLLLLPLLLLLLLLATAAPLPGALAKASRGKRRAPTMSPEMALRRTITDANTKATMVKLTLTNDVTLTGPLPQLTNEAGITIEGKCKDGKGKPRRCVVDGADSHTIFSSTTEMCTIVLRNLVLQRADGSAIRALCHVDARSVSFLNNKGPSGAVLDRQNVMYNTYTRNITFVSCEFINNTATTGDGGALSLAIADAEAYSSWFYRAKLTVTQCSFVNNRAPNGNGGAIAVTSATVVLSSVTFDGNAAGEAGGAVNGTKLFLFQVYDSKFTANTAVRGRGGAISAGFDYTPFWVYGHHFHFCNDAFKGNKAGPAFRKTDNIALYKEAFRMDFEVTFCPKVADHTQIDSGFQVKRNCTGCTGCPSDCFGRGKCVFDEYNTRVCQCSPNFGTVNLDAPCTVCDLGYTPFPSCKTCSLGFFRDDSKKNKCTTCPQFAQAGVAWALRYAHTLKSAATLELCRTSCRGEANNCTMWIYAAPSQSRPDVCNGKCILVRRPNACQDETSDVVTVNKISWQTVDFYPDPPCG